MALFIGSFENKVDRKGRVSAPATFRAALAGQKFNGIVCFPSLHEPAIEAFSESDMERLAESLEQLDQFSEEREDLATIFAESLRIPFDGDGRIILPPEFLGHAGITDIARFVSAVDHFQIWSPQTYADKRNGARDRLKARRATLRVRPSTGNGPFGSGPADGR
jgi:MraZ protein